MSKSERARAIPVLTLLAFLIGTGVVLQLWLLGAALEGFLGDKRDIALPAALGSVALLLVNLAFLSYVLRIDRHVRKEQRMRAEHRDLEHPGQTGSV